MSVEIEDIILNKEFFELTEEERTLVNEIAADEDEFEAIKWTLSQTRNEFDKSQIIPSGELRSKVMAHLEDSDRKKVLWLNSVGAFMLPKEKSFFQKPAIQIGIAAVLILGFLTVFKFDVNEPNLANNEQKIDVQRQESIQETTPLIEKEMEVELFTEDELTEIEVVDQAPEVLSNQEFKGDTKDVFGSANNGKNSISEDLKYMPAEVNAEEPAAPVMAAPQLDMSLSDKDNRSEMLELDDAVDFADEEGEMEKSSNTELNEIQTTARKDYTNAFRSKSNISKKEKAPEMKSEAVSSGASIGKLEPTIGISIVNSNELKSLFLTYN
ncbi:hypothetical protein [Crocinitomix catalasitica]|uniref:hypothetical protein n=1 Tax=Crocinitomix catalasitica TaxID=184607 RepID=UPI000485C0A7|nr:hypothetical protein [Crocinitomix catalasitica]